VPSYSPPETINPHPLTPEPSMTTAYYTTGTRLDRTHLTSTLDACGHKHRTAATAERCRQDHARDCARSTGGGYSQRDVYAVGSDGMADVVAS